MVNDKIQSDGEFDEPVARLLRDLKRVDAPKDFDHRVRARIAQGRPERTPARPLYGWAKAAVPAALVLAAGGYFGWNALSAGPASTETIAAVQPLPAAVRPEASVPTAPPLEPAAPQSMVSQVRGPSSTVTSPSKPVAAPSRSKSVPAPAPVGGSIDSAVRIGKTIEIPDVPVTDALSRAGAKVVFDEGTMKVSASEASADRSGLKAGDVIESIDGRTIDAKSTLKGNAAGKRLRVRRDGKTLDIVLKN